MSCHIMSSVGTISILGFTIIAIASTVNIVYPVYCCISPTQKVDIYIDIFGKENNVPL